MVSSKVLGHISEGLYRGPAGVIKELVSNAFDANAKTVWISTGRPNFDVVSIKDDGDGMPLQKFTELVTGGIGASSKRLGDTVLINNRPVIGRLGIGLLGVSQISHEFSIVSHARRTKSAFQARISMKDYRSEVLDKDSPTTSYGQVGGNQSETRNFAVGEYEVAQIPFDPNRTGLTITATDPTEGFRLQLAEDDPTPLPKHFQTFSERSSERHELATGPLYNRMVWQVASLIPVPYLSDCVVHLGHKAMTEIANVLEHFDFTVILDGVKLFKPVLLDGPTTEVGSSKTAEGEGPFHFPLDFKQMVWGETLRVRGYIHGSKGVALHPDDIRGVLIRLKHVGIGEYDKSFLGYRIAEGPRFAWLTGELFIERGLEDALTVGRDGFDTGHPHYIALRKWLHSQLHREVFPTLIKGIRFRRSRREAYKSESRDKAFSESIAGFAGRSIEIIRVNKRGSPPIHVDLKGGVATINNASAWPRGKRQRETAQNLSVIFELVRLAGPDRDAVNEFIQLTKELLSQR